MQRLACTLILSALSLVCALVALLLSDVLAPGRASPMLAFYAACGSGLMLIIGLMLLERKQDRQHLPFSGQTFSG